VHAIVRQTSAIICNTRFSSASYFGAELDFTTLLSYIFKALDTGRFQ